MRLQKRTRRIAKLLTLSLILSGLPTMPTYAAQTLEQEEAVTQGEAVVQEETAVQEGTVVQEETAVQEETVIQDENVAQEGTVVQEETAVQEETTEQEAAVVQKENVSVPETNVKMAGSDGIFYDDVLYLSARNVIAMDERLQARYRKLCDEIAAAKADGIEVKDVTFAMDANGVLHCSYSVAMRGLDTIMAKMLPDLEETPVLNLETKGADLLSDTAAENADQTVPDEKADAAERKDETPPPPMTERMPQR